MNWPFPHGRMSTTATTASRATRAALGAVLTPLQDEFQRTRTIPAWAGVDLLRAWAFWCTRAHYHSGGYRSLTQERPEVLAIVEALRRHSGATAGDRPRDPSARWPYDEHLRELCERTGRTVRRYVHPIPDNSVIDHAGYDAIVAHILAETNAGHTVYLHCWGGKGRTTTVVGCLLARSGLNYADTITRVAELRSGTRKAKDPCPETTSQRNLLRERCAGS